MSRPPAHSKQGTSKLEQTGILLSRHYQKELKMKLLLTHSQSRNIDWVPEQGPLSRDVDCTVPVLQGCYIRTCAPSKDANNWSMLTVAHKEERWDPRERPQHGQPQSSRLCSFSASTEVTPPPSWILITQEGSQEEGEEAPNSSHHIVNGFICSALGPHSFF